MESPLAELPGYRITARLHDGLASAVYRAMRQADNLPVVVKLLKPSCASALAHPGAVFSFALPLTDTEGAPR
jgi:hypothetical protein